MPSVSILDHGALPDGQTNNASGNTGAPVVLHYDGADWSQVDVPSLGESITLDSIAARASDDVRVFGHRHFSGVPFALHFDGSDWTTVDDPDLPRTGAALALGPDAIWLGGELGQTALSLFDGDDVVFTDDLAPANQPTIRALRQAGPCDVWAAGRRSDGGLAPLIARMTADTGAFDDMGFGLVGSAGMPGLDGAGDLAPGSSWSLAFDGALPGAPSWLVLGAAELSAPFKGGVLVPAPDLVVLGLATDAAGAFALPATWPAGGERGLDVVVQLWSEGGGGPVGWSASNGVCATTE